ncbi:MAG TPA: hypothetical protein VJM12_15975 [Pyrinomonadaceae bacterium]|nr:hypothetical protein [Pyrinomonadaceae bacterium]
MRNRLISMLVVLLLPVVAAPVHPQNRARGTVYYYPLELKLERATWRNFRDYRRQRPREKFAIEAFYPIGWSPNGKFAYYLEPVDEACHCYFAKLFIIDLKTDKVLWSFDYNSEFMEEAKKEGRPYTLDGLWQANQKLFWKKLVEHGIEPQGRFSLLSFPIRHKRDLLTANLRTKEKPGLTEEDRLYGIIDKAIVHLNSRRHGRKTVFNYSYGEVRPLYVGLVGYLKSPHEPRIAILLLEVLRGYEGPPHTARVRVVGAGLEDFKRAPESTF